MGQTRAKYSLQPTTNAEHPGAGGNTPPLHTHPPTPGAILLTCSTKSSYKHQPPGVLLRHEQNSYKYALQTAGKYSFKNSVLWGSF